MEDWQIVISMILGILLLIGVIAIIDYGIENKVCSDRAKLMGFNHNYGYFQKCFIQTNEGWINIEKYRIGEFE